MLRKSTDFYKNKKYFKIFSYKKTVRFCEFYTVSKCRGCCST